MPDPAIPVAASPSSRSYVLPHLAWIWALRANLLRLSTPEVGGSPTEDNSIAEHPPIARCEAERGEQRYEFHTAQLSRWQNHRSFQTSPSFASMRLSTPTPVCKMRLQCYDCSLIKVLCRVFISTPQQLQALQHTAMTLHNHMLL